ncbi:hypothetical protein IBN19_03993 [Escherichia coli]|nr:hypothetical protein [Escherichia coli]
MACTVIFPMMCSVVSQKPYQALLFTGIERTSQIKPIPELHSAPPPITFLPIGQVAVAPGQRSFDAVTLTISISPFPAFFHEPDWHWPPCQSGSWKSIGSAAPWTSVTSFTLYPTTTKALGKFKLCVNTYRIDGKETAMTRVWPTDNPDVNGEMNWSAYNGTLYSSYYITVHCFR